MTAGHGNDFHRQGEVAQDIHFLGVVSDADEGLGHRGHDFLPGEGSAAAFDQFQPFVGFIGSVDVELQLADGIQFVNRNAVAFQPLGGGFGAGHGTVKVVANFRQHIDKEVGSAAGANTYDAVLVQMRADMVQCGFGHCLFQFVLGHGGSG